MNIQKIKMVKVATYSDTCKSIEEHLNTIEGKDILVRMGGTMEYSKYPIHINNKIGTEISMDKFRFMQFSEAPLPTLMLFNLDTVRSFVVGNDPDIHRFVIEYANDRKIEKNFIIKPIAGSGGEGVQIVPFYNNVNPYLVILDKIGPFIIQPKINVTSEYRVHVCRNGEFKVTKKVKNNPEDQFITRGNHKVLAIENAIKPRKYKEMIAACQKTASRMGMDIICFDVLYDSTLKDNHQFFIIESNTGPELLGTTKEWYINQINSLIQEKSK